MSSTSKSVGWHGEHDSLHSREPPPEALEGVGIDQAHTVGLALLPGSIFLVVRL